MLLSLVTNLEIRQKAESRRQKAEGRRQKADGSSRSVLEQE
jgi:hypothetical protein